MPRREPAAPYAGPTVEGIDVSHWQGEVDWPAVRAAGMRYVYVRTGDGRDADRLAVENLRGAQRAGLYVGAYHYLRAYRGSSNLEVCLGVIDRAGVALDLPIACDIEGHPGAGERAAEGAWWTPGGESVPQADVEHVALAFLRGAEAATQRTPLVYGGQSLHWYFAQQGTPAAAQLGQYPLWLASYGDEARMPVDRDGAFWPWRHWTWWQYTSRGRVDGVGGDVDINRFRGSLADLERLIHGATPDGVLRASLVSELRDLALRHKRAPELAAQVLDLAERLRSKGRVG